MNGLFLVPLDSSLIFVSRLGTRILSEILELCPPGIENCSRLFYAPTQLAGYWDCLSKTT